MPKITVYKVEFYDIRTDECWLSRRMATEKGASIMHGGILRDTAVEIDDSRLEPGKEWTVRDFVP